MFPVEVGVRQRLKAGGARVEEHEGLNEWNKWRSFEPKVYGRTMIVRQVSTLEVLLVTTSPKPAEYRDLGLGK